MMRRPTQKDLKITSPAMNGAGQRQCTSWIDSFVEYTENLESPRIWRKWAAISVIAAVLEQKVYLITRGSPLYPNLYTFIVGPAGRGKSLAIGAGTRFFREVPEVFLGPTSTSMAKLSDELAECKREIPVIPGPMIEYNTIYFANSELSSFLNIWDSELVGGMTHFYDVEPYGRKRVARDVNIHMDRPQLNMIIGATPSNLMALMPEVAWEQGLCSRFILIYSNEQPFVDIFNTPNPPMPKGMIHDLRLINGMVGQMDWTEEWSDGMTKWKLLGYPPVPKHPKLMAYCQRRFSHLMKLSMIASVDRGESYRLTKEDFNRAMGWLLEAEEAMPEIFRTGAQSADSRAMEDIAHYCSGKHVPEHVLLNYARQQVSVATMYRLIEIMTRSQMLTVVGYDEKTRLRIFTAG